MNNEAEKNLAPQIVESMKAPGLIDAKDITTFEENLLGGKISSAQWRQYAEMAIDKALRNGVSNG